MVIICVFCDRCHISYIFDFCSQTRERLVQEQVAQWRGRLILTIKIQQDNHYHPYDITPQTVEYVSNNLRLMYNII